MSESCHLPDFERFRELAKQADMVPVYRRLVSDSLTPVSAFHKLDDGRCAFLGESVTGGERVGRYSFLATHPFLEIEAYEHRVTINSYSGVSASGTPLLETRQYNADNPVDELRKLIEGVRTASLPELPPFCAGAVGYVGYDVVRYCEHLPNPPPDDRHIPDMAFAFYDRMVIFDNVTKAMVVVAMAHLKESRSPEDAYREASARVDEVVQRLSTGPADLRPFDLPPDREPQIAYRSSFTKEGFEEAVRRCIGYIEAGDIFQVVISQRLELDLQAHPFEVYRALRVINPSPFMFYVRSPSVTLVGSSPEILVRVVNAEVITRPLAGTRPRGKTEDEDRRLAEELLADPKERAEHVMLVDLGRNDLGRVCRFGSIQLSDVMTVERYSHVMHITSNVCGMLAPDKTPFDALQSCLPAGTVSGAPKVRAMQIIDELEPVRRGPYAGAVGYFDFCGNMDTCIALRTLVVKGRKAYIQAGAGIVADSIPENEWRETLNKARGLLRAVEVAQLGRPVG
ncbi:MAG: anthranilate synthase component I [Thermogutta sp.]